MAQVTGGITPVYAAPETFDGVVTRFCDQYSLACVYQELLTGRAAVRRDQHEPAAHAAPAPAAEPRPRRPPCDRPALARALAKKPEDRWPSVAAFVRGLLSGSASGRLLFAVPRPLPEAVEQPPVSSSSPPPPVNPAIVEAKHSEQAALPDGRDAAGAKRERDGRASIHARAAGVEGAGPATPALVIGLGQTGLNVLRRLRYELTERYGQPEMLPIMQSLYIDTDPEDLDAALKPDPPHRLAGLDADDVFPARLQRAAHYLKPRLSGRSLTEGWLDPQMLYKIPRTLLTTGVRHVRAAGVLRPLPFADGEDSRGHR